MLHVCLLFVIIFFQQLRLYISYILLQVRDYIHVVDLSDGHIAALQKLFDGSNIGAHSAYNLLFIILDLRVGPLSFLFYSEKVILWSLHV